MTIDLRKTLLTPRAGVKFTVIGGRVNNIERVRTF